jgi:hypothetical protein
MRYERYETNEYIKRVQAYQDPTESLIEDTDSNFNYAYTLVQENQAQSLHFNSMDHPMSEEDEEELDKRRYYNLQKDEKEDAQKQIDELIKSQNACLNAEKPKLTEEKNEIKLIKKATQEKTNVVLSVNKKRKLLNQKIHRIDYLIKKFKTKCFSKYALNKLIKKIKNCQFQSNLKDAKVYLPDHAVFTSETNYRKNQVFLTMTLREIFSLGNKQKNVDLFNMISNSTNYQDQEAYDELINYLDKTGEEIIKEFYGSPEFETFKEENKEGDEAFKQEKKFSFMEKDGFLKLIKNNY